MDVACVLLFVHVLRDVTGDYFLKASEFFKYSVNNFYCTMFPHVQDLQSMAVSFLHTTPLHTTTNYSTPLHSTPHNFTPLRTTPHNSTPHNSPQLHSTTHNSLQFHSITHNSPQLHFHSTQLDPTVGAVTYMLYPPVNSTTILSVSSTLTQWLVDVLPDFLEGCVCACVDLPPLFSVIYIWQDVSVCEENILCSFLLIFRWYLNDMRMILMWFYVVFLVSS